MMFNIHTTCPFCGTEFMVSKWINGECPECKLDFWWTEEDIGNFQIEFDPIRTYGDYINLSEVEDE